MVVGQDWGGVPYYPKYEGLDDLQNPTMRALERLLRSIGFDVSLSAYGTGHRGVFLTNAILCLKQGGLQDSVKSGWFGNCAPRFLRRQIEIVRPRVAVTLGQRAYDAVRVAFNLNAEPLAHAVQNLAGTMLLNGTRLFAVYHCGIRTQNINRPLDQQIQDWQRVATGLGLAGPT
jgi:uracil-DNA glycosylase